MFGAIVVWDPVRADVALGLGSHVSVRDGLELPIVGVGVGVGCDLLADMRDQVEAYRQRAREGDLKGVCGQLTRACDKYLGEELVEGSGSLF